MTERISNPWLGNLVRTVVWIGLGILVGISVGLLVGWVLWPLEYTEADPSIMEESYQRDYTIMIASAYAVDNDLALARDRLRSLGMDDPDGWLLTVTVDYILQDGDELVSQNLVHMANALDLYSPAMDPYIPLPVIGEDG